MSRTVRVTAGDRDYIWFRATDVNGDDISADTVVVGLGTHNTPPANPINPNGPSDLVQHPGTSVIRVGLLVAADDSVSDGAHVVTPGTYYGWIKITDAPTTSWALCGRVVIV